MASPPSVERPLFLIIAGPNGSGKSSAYEDSATFFAERTIWIVNPDRLTARIRDAEALPLTDANLAAVQRLEKWLEASIDVHKSIGVETVLSTTKYRRLVDHAKQRGFDIGLVYVILDNPARNVARVAARVEKGGHAVAEDAIRRRYRRSLEQLPWFLNAADYALLYDNSGAVLRQVGEKTGDIVTLDHSAPAVLIDALQT